MITASGLVSWQKYRADTNNPSNNIPVYYEDFSCEVRTGTTKEYQILFAIPLLLDNYTNCGIVHAKLLYYGKDIINVICHNQGALGFIVEFYDNATGDQLSLTEVYNMVGNRYVNFLYEI